MRRAATAAGVLACLLTGTAWSQPCPPRLVGPDPAALDAVRRHLSADLMPTSTATAACVPLVVEVRPEISGLHLAVVAAEGAPPGPSARVQSPATAASLVAAWSASAVADLAWVDPDEPRDAVIAPAPGAATATVALAAASAIPAPPGPPDAAPGGAPRGLSAPAPRPTPQGALAVGPVGVVSEGGALGAGLEAAWRVPLAGWRLGPTLRLHADRQSGDATSASGRALEVGAGGQLRRPLWAGPVTVDAQATLRAAYRLVDPTELVGNLPCTLDAPCALGDPVPASTAPYHAFTGWAELGLGAALPLPAGLALSLEASFGLSPGFATVGDPDLTPSTPGAQVRLPPRLPRWRAGLQVNLQWEGR